MAIRHGDGRVEHAGCVVREMERNGHDDSDFYALVYDRFASCTDCRGTGWRDRAHEGTWLYGREGVADYFPGKGMGDADSETSYGLVLTLMDGNYAMKRIVDDPTVEFSAMVPSRGCHYEKHESVKDRKYLTNVVGYMGIPEPYACETCGGSGKLDHPDGGYFHWIEWGTTRFACDAGCSVDATDEVKALFKEWSEANRVRMKAGLERIECTKLRKGRRVRVVRGRKVPIGTEGDVFWHGADRYAPRWSKVNDEFTRIGIVTDDGEKFFLAGSNCEVLVDLTGDGDWVLANDLVMPGDSDGLYRTPEGWTYAAGFAYVG